MALGLFWNRRAHRHEFLPYSVLFVLLSSQMEKNVSQWNNDAGLLSRHSNILETISRQELRATARRSVCCSRFDGRIPNISTSLLRVAHRSDASRRSVFVSAIHGVLLLVRGVFVRVHYS